MKGHDMMGQGFGDAVFIKFIAVTTLIVAALFVLGLIVGSTFPKLWEVLRPLIHAATA